ncbi:hypothetical protein ACGFJC_03965 [Nonomuraea fuscirosea]|jgi:hypothetical protein|uniref:hypothetical protein n=1 Tax=Nonomuraea fuscirosea TaxID=1291556 RepID=UPI002DD9963A|nr:hypothetical protein [Nonomuraea fuscirosea]WSA57858.1 hypothetical protein OIE67_25530 [Nonomuraea fuscirosea]
MSDEAQPTIDDLLSHARQSHELMVLLKHDREFERQFSAAVDADDDQRLSALLAPLGIERASIVAKDERLFSVCERCYLWHGKWVCHPICK